jgi:hypothetical protein
MPKPSRPKKKPPIEISDDNKSIGETPIERNNNRFLFSSSFLSSSSLPKKGEKREHPQTSPKKENQKPTKKKPITTTDGTPSGSIPFPPLSPEQHLQKALESLT